MHNKIEQTSQELILDLTLGLRYYGNFLSFLNIEERKDVKNCGINVTNKGMNFNYNPDYIDRISQKEVNFSVLHNIFHLLWNHPKRTVTGQFNQDIASLAQDMIINHVLLQDIDDSFIEPPKDEYGQTMAVLVPVEYKGELVFELLYEWLRDKQEEYNKNKMNGSSQEESEDEGEEGEGENEGEGSGNDSDGKPAYGEYAQSPTKGKNNPAESHSLTDMFDNIDETKGEYLDQHMTDEVPEELREAMVQDLMAKLEARGFETGKISKSIEKLRKKRKDYLTYIKRAICNEVFGTKKQPTITKPNRRGILGLKGKKKYKTSIVVILDTSGSMGGTFERVLSYIYRNDIEIILIEADTEVKWIQNVKRKQQLDSVKIHGHGGTVLQPAINLVAEKFNTTNLLVLTDGICDKLDVSRIKGNVLMISINKLVPIAKSNGKLKQILVGLED